MTRRLHSLLPGLLLPYVCAIAPAMAQDANDVAEDRDIAFIEQCLQRATEAKIDEDHIDAFIDHCIDEFYAQKERAAGAEDSPGDGDDADMAPQDDAGEGFPSD